MPYNPQERNKAEKAALAEIKKVIKGKGERKGVFYIATKADAEKGSQASVVVNSFLKDKNGSKTLSAGKGMKTAMGATAMMRGLVEFSGGVVVLNVMSKKGSARLMKKQLWQDLDARAKGDSEDFDKPTAKNLMLIFKKCKIQDATESPEEALDEEEHGVEEEKALTREELLEVGVDPDEVDELDVLEAHFASKMVEMTKAFQKIMGDTVVDADHDDELLQRATLSDLTGLKSKLASYDKMSSADKTEIQKQIQAQIDLIGTKSSGENPFPDELGGVIAETDAILLEVVKATEGFLVGDRTMGMETEYVHASVRNLAVWASSCPTCSVKAKEPCKQTVKTEKFIAGYHKSRAALGAVDDHTHVFVLTRNLDSKVLCEWDFETQGKGARFYGTLEAVTKPWVVKAPKSPPEAVLAHQQLIQDVVEAIDLVQSKRKSQIKIDALVSAVQSGLTNKGNVTFAKAGGCPGSLTFKESPDRAPQITFSTSLAGFQETCLQGFPAGVQQDARMEVNNHQLKVAALDGDDLYNAVVGAIDPVDGGDAAHRSALSEGKIGPRLKGFSTVVAAWAAAIAVGETKSPVDSKKPDGWDKALVMPHPSMVKPPRGPLESDDAFDLRMKAAAKEKTFYWMKDQFAIMPKVPMALLAQDGGLTPEELALCQAKEDEFVGAVAVILRRYGVDLDVDAGNGETIEDYLRGKVLTGKPPGGSKPKVLDQWRTDIGSAWADTTGAAEGHEITHRDQDGSLRMVTEVRMCSGKHSSKDLVDRLAQRIAEVDQGLMQGALADVFI